jgi:hypothetical protein
MTIEFQRVQYVLEKISPCDCFLAPPIDGWITIFFKEDRYQLYADISSQLKTLVFVVKLYDDDIFYYDCYFNGHLIDSYDSAPGCFSDEELLPEEKERLAGMPEKWVDKIPFSINVSQIKKILSTMQAAEMFLEDYPEQFCQLLHLPNAMMAYEYIHQNNTDDLVEIKQLNDFIFIQKH